MGGLGLLVVIFWLPATPQPSDGGRAHIADRERLGEALWGRGLGILYASIFCLHLLLMAAFTAIPSVMTQQVGLAPVHHAWMYLATLCGALPGVALLIRRRYELEDPRPLLALTVVLTVIGLVIALWAVSLTALGLGLVLFLCGLHRPRDDTACAGLYFRSHLAARYGDGHFCQCSVSRGVYRRGAGWKRAARGRCAGVGDGPRRTHRGLAFRAMALWPHADDGSLRAQLSENDVPPDRQHCYSHQVSHIDP